MPNLFNILDSQEIIVPRTAVATNLVVIPFAAPARLTWLHVTYTSTAAVGNRQLVAQLLDAAANVLMDSHAGATQAASLVNEYEFMQGIYRETAFLAGSLQCPIPFDWVFIPGYQLKIFDSANVAAADSFVYSYATRLP